MIRLRYRSLYELFFYLPFVNAIDFCIIVFSCQLLVFFGYCHVIDLDFLLVCPGFGFFSFQVLVSRYFFVSYNS